MPEKSLWEQLALRPTIDSPVALVGGGGKTSSIARLARQARQMGHTVLIATTTHMRLCEKARLCQSVEEVREALRETGLAVGGVPCGDSRFGMLPELEACLSDADVVLLEADGAKMRALKAPGRHEPVLLPQVRSVVGVAGLDSIGQPIGHACHRPQMVCELLGADMGHAIVPEDVFQILASDAGARKNVGGRAYRCILNKADTPPRAQAGEAIVRMLAAAGIPAAITSYGRKERDIACLF